MKSKLTLMFHLDLTVDDA